MTVGLLREPWGEPVVQGFVDAVPGVFGSAEGSPGFLGRSVRDVDVWGEFCVPEHFLQGGTDPLRVPSTLSLWEDLESVAAFSYRGAHGAALSQRKEWFVPPEVPGFVAWWVPDDHRPTFHEAVERWNSLHKQGSTPFAFDFRLPFDADGQTRTLDRERVRALGTSVQ